jgi:hypothetical protein
MNKVVRVLADNHAASKNAAGKNAGKKKQQQQQQHSIQRRLATSSLVQHESVAEPQKKKHPKLQQLQQ